MRERVTTTLESRVIKKLHRISLKCPPTKKRGFPMNRTLEEIVDQADEKKIVSGIVAKLKGE
ncbi:MAG: hypothetical protein H8E10_10670 [Desulfobacterales bacterium]|nr:hypothetical protein [Desulfobacterales bacterium]